jgi:hypothetical protein
LVWFCGQAKASRMERARSMVRNCIRLSFEILAVTCGG